MLVKMTLIHSDTLIITISWMLYGSSSFVNCEGGDARTKCGRVPPNEDMMKVVKPMAMSFLHFLPVMADNNVTISEMFDIVEEICGAFATCYPGGSIIQKTPESPGAHCLVKAITESTPLKDVDRASLVVQSLIESLPAKKRWFYAGMHWIIAMAEID